MPEDFLRPDPDALLAEIAIPAPPGPKLRIFLGMCPGVGKTYAMLRAALALAESGGEVVVGVVETHGRRETAELLEGLEIVPLHQQTHREITLTEMDLDAILARKPSVVLVDELAHTNAPGSRHPKRHQDVGELLNAGISVWTTVNIQHVESRADVITELTGVKVRETVPDALFDRADDIVLIDLPPEQLRQRMTEGKVYHGERAVVAADQFFRMGNLTALRELALRYAADRAGHDFRKLASRRNLHGPLRTNEKLLVAIGSSPTSESLIRWTRRVAGMLDATWLAVTVDTGRPLSGAARTRLSQHIGLAQGLGAEILTTSGQDIAAAVLAVAHEQHATQIVVGKPDPRLRVWNWGRSSMVNQIIAGSGHIDVHVVQPRRDEAQISPDQSPIATGVARTFWQESGIGAGCVAAVTLLCLLIGPILNYRTVALLYLVVVLLAALRLGRWPILATAAFSALAWDFFFIPPRFTLTIQQTPDLIMFATYFVAALVIGQVTTKLRRQQLLERRRERRSATLLGFQQLITSAPDEAESIRRSLLRLGEIFPIPLAFLRRNDADHSLLRTPADGSTFDLTDKEWSVAAWVQTNRQAAGKFTTTLPDSRLTCLPVQTRTSIMGVLALAWSAEHPLAIEDRSLIEALASQLALVLEKEHLADAMLRAELTSQSSRLHKALLDSVSHELKTPIAALRAALDLQPPSSEPRAITLRHEMDHATRRLERVTTQLLDMTRVDSGYLRPQHDWCDVEELIHTVADHQISTASRSRIIIDIHTNFPPVLIDAGLLETILTNLVLNALVWAPAPSPVEITVARTAATWTLRVRDHGPGIAQQDIPKLFDKFFRAAAAPPGGTGLGLSIVAGFTRIMGGEISVINVPDGGALFTITFPWKDAGNKS